MCSVCPLTTGKLTTSAASEALAEDNSPNARRLSEPTSLRIEPDMLLCTVTEPDSIHTFWQGWVKWSAEAGIDYFIGRKIPACWIRLAWRILLAKGTPRTSTVAQIGRNTGLRAYGNCSLTAEIGLRYGENARGVLCPLSRSALPDQRNHLHSELGGRRA